MKRQFIVVIHEIRSRKYRCRVPASVSAEFDEVFGVLERAQSRVEQLYLPYIEQASVTGKRIASSFNAPEEVGQSAIQAATSEAVPVSSGSVAAKTAHKKCSTAHGGRRELGRVHVTASEYAQCIGSLRFGETGFAEQQVTMQRVLAPLNRVMGQQSFLDRMSGTMSSLNRLSETLGRFHL